MMYRERPQYNARSYQYDGKTFSSAVKLAEYLDADYNRLCCALRACDYNAEKAVKKA